MDLMKMAEYGDSADIKSLALISEDIINHIKKLREILCEKNDLLDKFIFGILTALNQSAVSDITNGIFDDMCADLRHLCLYIRDGRGNMEHPLYSTVKDYIEKHPCPVPSMYIDYYCALLSLEYSEFALKRYIFQRKETVRAALNESNMIELTAELEKSLGTSLLEELCELFYKRLIIAPASNVFLQSMVDQLVLSCLTNDKTSSRYLFQYLLD